MMLFVTSAIVVLLLTVICYTVLRNVSVQDETKDSTTPLLFGSAVLSMTLDCILGGGSADMLMIEIMPSLICMNLRAFSLWENRRMQFFICFSVILSLIPVLIDICVAVRFFGMPSSTFYIVVLFVYLVFGFVIFFIGISRHLRNVRQIMKNGTVWSNVALAVDSVYFVMMISITLGYMAASAVIPDRFAGCILLFPLMAGGMMAALGVRKADDAMFVFWRSQERRIVESMKVTKVEIAADPSGIDDVYQDIYERVIAYFDAEKPFLDNELTINDLVKVLYSNKLYISRAISQFTGRNFCQFVNYYRVIHSMEVFRANPDMKIHELAASCGFNSDVSYNMAFRLFMGETPGEWCKKERSRKFKVKK